MQTTLTWNHICEPYAWRTMRSIAYANNGLMHKLAGQHKPLILFIDGQEHERRNFPATKKLLPELKKKFPDAEVHYELISELTGAVSHILIAALAPAHRNTQFVTEALNFLLILHRPPPTPPFCRGLRWLNEAHACAGERQLELLARTTVLVSTIGSRSFRMALLPDGAQVHPRRPAPPAVLSFTCNVMHKLTVRMHADDSGGAT